MRDFQDSLKDKMDGYAHFIYKITKKFPKDELYGIISQIRRAGLSIILNYIEGYARYKPLVRLNFLEVSYGSLKESKYLLNFSFMEHYTAEDEYTAGMKIADEIGAMLWTEIAKLKKSTNEK